MSTIINTAFLAGPSRSAPGQARIFLRRLIKQLAADAQWRTPPPISLPGRPVAVVVMKPVEPAPAPPVARVGYGPTLDCARGEVNKTEAEPSDFRGPYSYARLLRMNINFCRRMERAFKRGLERRASAAACVLEHHRRIPVTALALSDTQLEILRRFAVPVPSQLRSLYLQSVSRRLAGVELGDGSVQAACIAAQREVINGARTGAA